MAEYIKREDVREKIEEILDDEWYCPTEERLNRAVEQTMSELPSKDIIFCKDCKYWYESTFRDGCDRGLCHIGVTLEDDYCSYGKTKGGVNMPPEDIDVEYQEQMNEEERELEEQMEDWVRVVRCKDCEYYEHTQYGTFCNNVYGLHEDTDGDDYCSYGERKGRANGE